MSKELWDKANEYLDKRSQVRKQIGIHTVEDFNGKFEMSHKIKCGFCGATYSRRSHQQNKEEFKAVWKCMKQTRLGRSYCPDSKTYDEAAIQAGFVNALKSLVNFEDDTFDKFIKSANDILDLDNPKNMVLNAERSIALLKDRQKKLIDLSLDGTITKDAYDIKTSEIAKKICDKEKEIKDIEDDAKHKQLIKIKLEDIKTKIREADTILVYDPEIFAEVIDKVYIGGYDDLGNKNPNIITYVFDMANDNLSSSDGDDYVVIGEEFVKYPFWSHVLQDDGARRKVYFEGFPIRIALKTK